MLKEIIDTGKYDIIHCHTPVGAMLARLAARDARKKGTKVIYTAHGFHFFKGAPKINWLAFYPAEWMLAPLTDVLITINKEDHAFALRKLKAKRIEYVPGVGIKTEKFRAPLDIAEKRRCLGFGEQDFLILTVAEMTPNKNHITVLRALESMKDREEFKHIHYLVCGRGEMWHSLERSAREMGIADHIHFLGYRTDAPELYRCCDMFAFVSFREGLSVAMMEAMSSGMSIVCTRIRGNVDLIEDGVSGLFTENNPEALAEQIRKLYADPQLRQTLGAGAAEKAKLYEEENVHEQMKKIYLSV